jgi:hypothetical protein
MSENFLGHNTNPLLRARASGSEKEDIITWTIGRMQIMDITVRNIVLHTENTVFPTLFDSTIAAS